MNLAQIQSLLGAPPATSIQEMLTQAVVLIVLSTSLSLVYYFTANSLSNRGRLARIFPLMALTTMLIISIIRSSLALSLGLVGALSIVRFRSAIKDPEELAYIFLTIALGLGFGANQPYITTVFYLLIIIMVLIQAVMRGKFTDRFNDDNSVHLQITFSNEKSVADVTQMLNQHTSSNKLTRFEQNEKQTMMFLVKPKNVSSIDQIKNDLQKIDKKVSVSVVQYQALI